MKKIFTYILFGFSVFCVHLYFLNSKAESSFSQISKTKSRNIANILSKRTTSLTEKQPWKHISLFKNSNPSLYQSIGNPNLLLSVQREKGVSIKQIPDLKYFFKQIEQEKAITLSRTSIKDRKVLFSKIESVKQKAALFYAKGTYVDFQQKLVFFEDWLFYHDKRSVYIVVHSKQHLTEQQSQSVHSFIHNTIKSETVFTIEDKDQLLTLLKRVRLWLSGF